MWPPRQGVSSGMVQHYFRTKDQMLQFALNIVASSKPTSQWPLECVRRHLSSDASTPWSRRLESA